MVAPYWGLRAEVDPGADAARRAQIFAARMPPRAFYFGRTAAAIHGLPLPSRFSEEWQLHVGVTAGERRVDALGIVPHHIRVGAQDLELRHGIAVTSIARTWCDLATCGLTLAELVAAGDRAIWYRGPLILRSKLDAALARYEGRRGVRLMQLGLPLLSDRADSAPESELRVSIILAGFPSPDVNVEIRLRSGVPAQPDLSWPAQKVAIEYEGKHHRTDRGQWHRDIRKHTGLQEENWSVYRATADDYQSPGRLLAWLSRHLSTPR